MDKEEYKYQKEVNIRALINDQEYEVRRNVIKEVVDIFEKEKVDWALSCSSQLFLNGVVDDFHDFDILIGGNTIGEMKKALAKMGYRRSNKLLFKCFFQISSQRDRPGYSFRFSDCNI